MKLDAVDPELRHAVARMPRLPVRRTWGRRVVRALVVRHGPGDPVECVDVRVLDEGPGLRVYTPAGGGSGAALLWVHGGGYVIGDVVQDNAFCALTARESDIVVVSANYRLAPEHPFPAALDDLSAAWQWVQESAGSLGIDQARIAVGGSSAGAGLAACLAQRLYDAGGIQPVGQWLFSPMLDDRTAARRELDAVRHRVWHNAANRTGWAAYLGTGPGASSSPTTRSRPGVPTSAGCHRPGSASATSTCSPTSAAPMPTACATRAWTARSTSCPALRTASRPGLPAPVSPGLCWSAAGPGCVHVRRDRPRRHPARPEPAPPEPVTAPQLTEPP